MSVLLLRLKAEMVAAHPDRGGSNEAFIAARARYVAAKKQLESGQAYLDALRAAFRAQAESKPEPAPPPRPMRIRLTDDDVRNTARHCGRNGTLPSSEFLAQLDARQARLFKVELSGVGRGRRRA